MTRRTIKHTITYNGMAKSSGENQITTVSLAGPPGKLEIPIDCTGRSETAPRGGPIRADRKWDSDSVVRHADNLGKRK